jgi:phosphate starvation-inducible protein PhoH and related proteins
MGKKTSRKHQNRANVLPIKQYLPEKPQDVKIIPRNVNQESYLLKLLDPAKDIVFGIGPAGTGKTLIAVQVAIKMFKERQVNKIVVTRPVVSVDEDIGFLPGSLEEKMAPWTIPIFDVFKLYFTTADIHNMLYEGIIEISPLAFMRGRTFHNSYIVADEMQNASINQMKMLLTRIGSRSKLAITGDLAQTDRPNDNGLSDFILKLNQTNANCIDVVSFAKEDVLRHKAVKEVLDIYGD